AQPPPSPHGGRSCGPGRQHRVPDLPDARGRVADRSATPARVPHEGRARGQDAHVVDQSRCTLRYGHRGLRGGAARSDPVAGVSRRLRRVPGARRPFRRAQLARADADQDHGSELWDLSLVDPDNRRPVDWAMRRRLLGELERALAATSDRAGLAFDLFKHKDDGRVKLYLTREALAFRRAQPALFAAGDYRPLEARGPLAEHLCAFARVADAGAVLIVVPRLLARRGSEAPPLGPEYWKDTVITMPAEVGTWFVNALTGERWETRGDSL